MMIQSVMFIIEHLDEPVASEASENIGSYHCNNLMTNEMLYSLGLFYQ